MCAVCAGTLHSPSVKTVVAYSPAAASRTSARFSAASASSSAFTIPQRARPAGSCATSGASAVASVTAVVLSDTQLSCEGVVALGASLAAMGGSGAELGW